jgi:hypothetical protein
MDRTKISEARFDGNQFELSVLDVFFENQRKDEAGKSEITASADSWGFLEKFRSELWQRVQRRWAERSKRPSHEFPYSADGVVLVYMKMRKRGKSELESIYTELGGANGGPSMFK